MCHYQYQVGGSLTLDAPSYVIREADTELFQALQRGEFCYVLNSRQMGKSSILVRTLHLLQREGYHCTTLDMTRIGSQDITPSQWYKGIVTELWRGLNLLGKVNLKSWWREEENLSVLQRLGNFVEDILLVEFINEPLVIFIDEVDSVLSLNFSIDDFFAWIRFCYNQRAINSQYNRLTFAIFGVATPSDLIADKKRTPFNIGRAIELHGFQLQESQSLVKGLESKVSNPQAVIKEILAWTNGQPFLTQKLCHLVKQTLESRAIASTLTVPPGTEAFWVENLVRDRIIDKWESQDEPEHLRTISDRILRNEQRAARLLGIYQRILKSAPPLFEVVGGIESDDSSEQTELILSGLVVKHQGVLQVKNRIYREVFNLKWVEKQLSALRPYSQALDAWIASGQTDFSRLLRGQALKDAQKWSQGKSLSNLDYQFLAYSEERDRQEMQLALEAERAQAVEEKLIAAQKAAKFQRFFLAAVTTGLVMSVALGIATFFQYRNAVESERQTRISEIKALTSSSQGLFASNRQLDAMLAAIKAKRRLQDLRDVDPQTTAEVETALQQAVYGSNEFNRLIGHQGYVLGVDISPDGQFIATGGNDRTVRVWKPNGTLFRTLQSESVVFHVAFSPDSRLIVAGHFDGIIKIWRVDGQLVKTIQAHNGSIWRVAFSPNGQLIASSSGDKTVKIWQHDGTLLKTLNANPNTPWGIAFSPDSQTLASTGADGTIKLWGIDGRLHKTIKGHQAIVWDVALCPKQNLWVSASGDRTAKLWALDGTLVRTIQAAKGLQSVACQGEFIAASDKANVVEIWKTDGSFIRNLPGHRAIIRDVALNSDGTMAASASQDRTVKLWRRNQYLLKLLDGHEDAIWEVATSPDGKRFASASLDGTLKLWQTDGSLWKTIRDKESAFFSLAFSPNGRMLVTGGDRGQVKLWDLGDRERLVRTFSGHRGFVFAVAISPDGKTIASAGDDKIVQLRTMDGKLLHSFVAHKEIIWQLAFSPQGNLLASASADSTVKLWKLDGTLVATLKGHKFPVRGLAFNPQGNLIASVSPDDTLKLWRLDGTLVREIQTESQGSIPVAFSPDGMVIATAGIDGTIKLWNLEGKLLRTLPGHRSLANSLAFTPDARFLVSGGDDSTVILWDLKKIRTLNELEYACNWVRDYLRTNAEVEERDRHLCDGIRN